MTSRRDQNRCSFGLGRGFANGSSSATSGCEGESERARGGMSRVSTRLARGAWGRRARATRARRGAAPRRAGRAALDRAPYRLRIESRRLGHREAVVATRHLSRPRRTDPRGRRARGGLAARAERVGAFSRGPSGDVRTSRRATRSRDHPPRARRGASLPASDPRRDRAAPERLETRGRAGVRARGGGAGHAISKSGLGCRWVCDRCSLRERASSPVPSAVLCRSDLCSAS